MELNFVYLSLMFLGTGILGTYYNSIIPDKKSYGNLTKYGDCP